MRPTLDASVALASVKRIFGTLFFVIAFLVTVAFFFLLYAKSINDENFRDFYDSMPEAGLVAGGVIGFIIVILILILLIRSSEERRRREAFQEEQERLASDAERMAAFEASLEEPEKIGWGPEIMVYNLPTIPQMHRAWDRWNRRTNTATFYYPRNVEAAVYTNNYIVVDSKGTTLKLRTLIAGPPGAQTKEPGSANMKRPPVFDPKTLEKLDPKWRKSYEAQHEAIKEKAAEVQVGGVTAATLGLTQTKKPKKEAAVAPPPEAPSEGEAAVEGPLVVESGGRSGMLQEMEKRFSGPETPAKAFYDYDGQNYKVDDIDAIGRIYGDKLKAAGVETLARLAYEDTQVLADRVGVPVRTVEQWKAMAELVKVSGIGPQYAEALARSGVMTVADLKRRTAGAIVEQVNGYLDGLHTGSLTPKITEKRVQGWQKAASGMRKVRMKVPEK
jgi:hypothetical protein